MILGAKPSATFNAAAFEDFLARFGTVAFHKTMFNFALTLVGLVGSFWHIIILSILTNSCSSIH